MKRILLLILLLIINVYSLHPYEDKIIGNGTIKLNVYADCINKYIYVKSNKISSFYLLYVTSVVDKVFNTTYAHLYFYGNIKYLTSPFTLRVEQGNTSRLILFWLNKCNSSNEIIVYEIKPKINHTVENETDEEEINVTNNTTENTSSIEILNDSINNNITKENVKKHHYEKIEEKNKPICLTTLFIIGVLLYGIRRIKGKN